MEIGEPDSGPGSARAEPPEGGVLADGQGRRRAFGSQRPGEILGEWQKRELRIARGFAECRGLSTEQLEDLYQETAEALYARVYDSEEHLQRALRDGIKKRARRLHRDERRHGRIVAQGAPVFRFMAEARAREDAPEQAALAREDRLIAREFTTELTAQERRVFAGLVEGMAYRAIATALKIEENEARKIARACERKRERFQVLYDTGRLCGYRAETIQALTNRQSTSEELAERAFAHLESCAHCRLAHKTNATRLRRSFRDQAAVLLPPLFVGNLGRLARLGMRGRLLLHRLGIENAPLGQGTVRERAVALLAGGGVGAKVAAGVLAVGVIAGGTVATHVLEHSPAPHRHHAASTAALAPRNAAAPSRPLSALAPAPFNGAARPRVHTSGGGGSRHAAGRHKTSVHRTAIVDAADVREPGGFAYLGVPQERAASAATAHAASVSEDQSGGGPFSP
jgi:hypothetical protein